MNTGFPSPHEEQENLLDAEKCLAQMMKSKMGSTEPDPGYEGADVRASKWMMEDQLSDLKCDLEGLETTLAKTE